MIAVRIDPAERARFARFLDRYEKHVGIAIDGAIRELAGVAARELAYHTQPWGLTAKVGKTFADNIGKQVNRAIRAGNVKGVDGSAETVHDHFRIKGSVPKGLVKRGRFKRAPVDRGDVERLIRKRVDMSGAVKGAWIATARDLGLRTTIRVPKWIARHAAHGNATVKIRGAGSTVILENDIEYASNVLSAVNTQIALKKAYRKQARRMAVAIDKASGGTALANRRTRGNR